MNLKNLMKIVGIILIFVILQSYFTNPESFSTIIGRWTGYFMTLIMAIFIAILLEPIEKYLKKKSKINDVLAISLSIVFVVLIVIIMSLIVIPEIISSLKVLNDMYPAISEKVLTIGKDVTNYLAEKNIYTVNTEELNDSITNFISNNTSNIKEFVFAFVGGLVNWTLGFTNLIIAFTLAFLILLDKKNLMKTLENLIKIIFGVKNTPYVMNKLKLSKDIFISYISGKIIVSFIVGLCVYIILLITGTPYAALSAILLGVGNMIPYVGSIFGGIVAFNKEVDEATAKLLNEIFLEIIIAPSFSSSALEILSKKKNIRLIECKDKPSDKKELIKVDGGILVQDVNNRLYEDLEVVTKAKPTSQEEKDLIFALKVVKFVKSNAIVVAKNLQTLGIGGGEVSRIWAAEKALERAKERFNTTDVVLSSDAFFPFRDVVELAAKNGVKAIIQPSGSVNDKDSIEECDKNNISMIFSKLRHFKH